MRSFVNDRSKNTDAPGGQARTSQDARSSPA
jgi:hypothetical protein